MTRSSAKRRNANARKIAEVFGVGQLLPPLDWIVDDEKPVTASLLLVPQDLLGNWITENGSLDHATARRFVGQARSYIDPEVLAEVNWPLAAELLNRAAR